MQPAAQLIRFALVLFILVVCPRIDAQTPSGHPELVTFQSGEKTFSGYLWRPRGEGPFRAVVWNYGSKKSLLAQGSPTKFVQLVKLYVENNYVLFIPDRTNGSDDKGKDAPLVSAKDTDDIVAAVTWLRQQSFVDATRVAISGTMIGAVQSLLAIERDMTLRGAIVFSPASHSWDDNPEMQERLQRAIDSTPVPVFLIQPQNDVHLGPSEVLGRKLARKAGLNRSRIYNPYQRDTRTFATEGVSIWGKDVLKFLDAAMK